MVFRALYEDQKVLSVTGKMQKALDLLEKEYDHLKIDEDSTIPPLTWAIMLS